MKTVIENINDITDSTELLESRPPSFTVIFIYLLIGLLVIAFAWTYIGEIDIVVKANGVVRPNQRISTINNIVTGKIDELYIENGKAVKKNDILYTLDYRDLQIRQTFIEEQIAMKKTDLKNQNTLKYSVIENKNSFIMQEDQEFYYYKYLKYEADKKQTIENVNLVINTIYNTQKILQNTQILLASIEENENLFKNTENEYYIKYLDYTFNKKDLQKDIDKKKINFEILEKLYKAGALAKFDYENAKDELEKAHLELERFENTTRLTLKSNIEENQRKLEQLKIQLQQIAPGVSTAIENHAEIAAENFRTENLILINETIKHLETEINQLENDLAGVKLDIQNCIIKAPIDGNINIITEINRGDNIVAGTTIATIIPEDDDNSYVIQIYASNEDISKVNIGDKVKYSFLALPYKEYGELTGKITKIATDTKITKDGSSSYYLVEADIQTEPLISYKGEESKIKIGMECEARVVTRTKKIIHYLLEKIDLRL